MLLNQLSILSIYNSPLTFFLLSKPLTFSPMIYFGRIKSVDLKNFSKSVLRGSSGNFLPACENP